MNVYLAGRIQGDEAYRFGLVPCDADICDLSDSEPLPAPDIRAVPNWVDLWYTGPYTIRNKHGVAYKGKVTSIDTAVVPAEYSFGGFGTQSHGACPAVFAEDDNFSFRQNCRTRQKEITNNSMEGIDNCDAFFAWVDSGECYGTLVEIGYAVSKGKRVFIASPSPLEDGELWFAATLADRCIVAPYAEAAVKWFFCDIGAKKEPRPVTVEKPVKRRRKRLVPTATN